MCLSAGARDARLCAVGCACAFVWCGACVCMCLLVCGCACLCACARVRVCLSACFLCVVLPHFACNKPGIYLLASPNKLCILLGSLICDVDFAWVLSPRSVRHSFRRWSTGVFTSLDCASSSHSRRVQHTAIIQIVTSLSFRVISDRRSHQQLAPHSFRRLFRFLVAFYPPQYSILCFVWMKENNAQLNHSTFFSTKISCQCTWRHVINEIICWCTLIQVPRPQE